MLTELRIRNFALIEELSVQLGPGLNVLTGETGAGKSIIVGALSLLLGERASAEVVRSGADRASVEGVFDVGENPDLKHLLDESGIDAEDDTLILKREVAVEGRNRAWVNGSPATAALLGTLGRMLVDLHGQHEHQTLLRRNEQRAILDAYAGTGDLVEDVAAAVRALRTIAGEIEGLDQRRREALQRADFLRFQLEEIDAASLRSGEEEELAADARRLSHSEELMELAGSLDGALAGGGGGGLVDGVGAIRRTLSALTRIDPAQAQLEELYDTAYYALDELRLQLQSYAGGIEHDPQRLEEIRRRQDLIFRLKSKYGPELEDVLAAGESARAELELLEGAEWELGELRKQEMRAREELQHRAAQLSERRAAAATELAAEVTAVLPALGMAGGRCEVALLPLAHPGPAGAEEVEFRVALNKGWEPRPLAQVASGGELSRVMLALKTILARLDAVPTLIFDEVDAGIGGKVALQVGEKMRAVARDHQVFAITHLPQIASRAHTHLLVQKREREGMGVTEVLPLTGESRVVEIARMLGGDPESSVSLEHARELLGQVAPVG